MTEDEDVLARMAALEAELRADPKVQADLKARQAERIRADQAAGDVPTILLDDSDPPGTGDGETRDQKRARAIAALKAKRAAQAGAATPAQDETIEQKRARAIARLKAERAAKNAAAAAAAAPKPAAALPAGKRAPAAPAPDPFDDLDDDQLLEGLVPARTSKPAAPAAAAKKPAKKKAKPDVGDALELAGRAVEVGAEATRPKEAGEKSWLTAGLLGLVFGPAGWVYAGAWRESLPAGAAYVGVGFLASKILPVFMLMPALLVVLPVSAIVGVVYAAKFNKAGKRQRVFGENPAPPEQLPAGRARGKLGPGRR